MNLSREIINLQFPHSLNFSCLLQHAGSYDRIAGVLSQACCVTSVPGIHSVLFFVLLFWKCFCCAAHSSAWFSILFVRKHQNIRNIRKVALIIDLWQSGLKLFLSLLSVIILFAQSPLVYEYSNISTTASLEMLSADIPRKRPIYQEAFCAKPSEFFIFHSFHSFFASKTLCYNLDFILPLTLLCVAQTASRWSLPQVSLFWKKPHRCHSPEDKADLKRLCTAQKVIFLSLVLRSYTALRCIYV